ncbi:hypothetical protein FS837_008836 [Tulasnella sp. UAMH 9824]|nr:hypothetical protein FS837_008836 [Tulasnella sp. UAMH 9824]
MADPTTEPPMGQLVESVAGSFISAKEGNGDPDGPSGDAMEVNPPTGQLVEEPATLNMSAEPSISPAMRQLPFAERTARPNASWTAYQPPGVYPSSHLSPKRGASPDSAEPDWMNYLAVDRKLVGKVKKPQGNPISCGGFSDVYKCEVRFDAPDDGNPKMVAVKVLRPVGLDGFSETESLHKMIERASREAHAWLAISHPNVVPLVGYTFTPLLSLVSSWHERGNIRSYIVSNPDVDRIKLLLDIAKGLAYLHTRNPPVVHGDIKPRWYWKQILGTPAQTDKRAAYVGWRRSS